MSNPELVILSTCIGAATGILSQFLANTLKDRSDKKRKKIDLIAEERKLAYMILLNQASYYQMGLTIEYYYQLAVIEDKPESENPNLQRHHEEIKASNLLHAEFCRLIGDYCKNTYELIHYIGHRSELENIMTTIINYRHEDLTGIFAKFRTYPSLFEAYSKENLLISERLDTYKSFYAAMYQAIRRATNNNLTQTTPNE